MTRIDYYILGEHENTPQSRISFAAKLINKVSKLGHKVYVHCRDENEAKTIDAYLWQFQAHSFLPHKLLHDDGPDCAIEIGYHEEPGEHDDVLVNLADHIPPCYSRFERVAEIVSHDQTTLEASRKNYRFYQDRNYPLHRHDMRRHR